jgi:lipopolysaccharide biosynthesis glycosyltransferase
VIASVARNALGANIHFIMLHNGVDAQLQKRVEGVAPQAHFLWIEVGDKDLPAYEDRGHLNRTVLFRLGLETLAPAECKRVIYLDADIVVLGDVRELWASDLDGAPLGVVRDAYVDADEFAQKWGRPVGKSFYFNAGMMVIDLEKIRAERSFSAALDFVVKHNSELLLGDQDALNYTFWGRWTSVDPAWNVQRYLSPKERAEEQQELSRRWRRATPAMVHFIGMEKPWMPNVWHPWAWMYWAALKHTPFEREVAATNRMDAYQLMRLRARWWLRRPSAPKAKAAA